MSTHLGPHDLDPDQRITLHGVSWDQYEAVLAIRGESSGVRLAYRKGELEFMSPSRPHEGMKCCIARLLEAWALHFDIDLDAFGSWTIKSRPHECGAEPDECYTRGPEHNETRPDIAIEVIWTSGGLDKLQIYRELDVPEVWIWRRDELQPWHLKGDRYVRRSRSAILPELDLPHLAKFATARGHTEAVKRYLRSLR